MPVAVTKRNSGSAARFRSLGIAGRLAISCAAVLVLVLATAYVVGKTSRQAAAQVALIESHFEPLAHLAQNMADGVAAFNQIALAMSSPDTPRDAARVDRALARLTTFADRYRSLAPESSGLMQEYLGKLASHELHARELLLLADRRRAVLQRYWHDFDRLNDAMRAAKRTAGDDGLLPTLARVQDTFGAYASVGGAEAERAVTQSELALRMALSSATSGLSEADAAGLREEFEVIVRARRELVGINNLMVGARQEFHDSGEVLTSFVNLRIAESSRRALADAAIEANRVTSDVDRSLWKAGLLTMSILLLISAATAYGVIIPVRRLIAAIQAMAAGERGKRVAAEGAVHELDTLADAFNVMAEQLEQAEGLVKRYQGQLEARVHERTQQLQYLAHHDPLTQLPNRRHFSQYLASALESAKRDGTHVGVLFLDLDNFKTINDTLGHESGDALLKAVGERLAQDSRGQVFVARLGGDEFTAIYRQIRSIDDITVQARSILERFQPAFEIAGKRLTMSLSIGAAVFPQHARDSAELLRAADAALARAKEAGRNRYSVYGPELLEASSARFQIEQDLRRAIEEGGFELFYQPIVSADSLEVITLEALLRWRRHDGSIVMPGQFIHVAERSGLIGEISDWVLETAARQAAAWRANGWPDVRIAINLSPQQLFDAAFHMRIESTLEKYSLPPRCLEIELTESAVQTGAGTIDALHWLRSLGVGLALDDFGTGYSSLTSLQQLPLTRIKIDRSLIHDVDSNPRSASIVRTIISLCRGLGLAVTVEGVERRAQFALLRAYAPVNIQGFLISQAVPILDIEAFVAGTQEALRTIASTVPALATGASVSDSMIVRQLQRIESDWLEVEKKEVH